MSSETIPIHVPVPAPHGVHGGLLDPHKVGMIAFLISEVAFFGTLIVAYVSFLGQPMTGPTPATLSLVLVSFTTLCLLSSSVTIHYAEKALHAGKSAEFRRLFGATIGLGVVFLAGTAYEWYDLIYQHGLTISRNMFGTTFFTLVGFPAAHVTIGVIIMSILLALAVRQQVSVLGITLISWYWHFVDGVWIVVFVVVYVVGTSLPGGK
jgi:cytochrome c oxidase subunit III